MAGCLSAIIHIHIMAVIGVLAVIIPDIITDIIREEELDFMLVTIMHRTTRGSILMVMETGNVYNRENRGNINTTDRQRNNVSYNGQTEEQCFYW
ncbi:MAG: hypothetical protein MZV64_08940 [Ignavibacteriales bacterium]|nr:hypothetical protein [Ignavibacteriales bacterium]